MPLPEAGRKMDYQYLMKQARATQRRMAYAVFGFVSKNVWDSRMRATRHFREWYLRPMNYARIMELPLTHLLLDPKIGERILDVSSPKLLALYYALNNPPGPGPKWQIVTCDMEDYFINDFEVYKTKLGLNVEPRVIDATQPIPFPEDHFDKIFSVSVLEHIPDEGDSRAVEQMLRVMRPGPSGAMVLTLPAATTYMEEWLSEKVDVLAHQDQRGGQILLPAAIRSGGAEKAVGGARSGNRPSHFDC